MITRKSLTQILGSSSPHLIRSLHGRVSAKSIPNPTPFVPDPSTFLKLIGRNLSQHTAKFPTWQSLFTLDSGQLREIGLEPARSRRYFLWWRDRFRKGVFGVGGDLKHVSDGVAELRIVEVPGAEILGSGLPTKGSLEQTQRVKRLVVNSAASAPQPTTTTGSSANIKPVQGMKIVGARAIVGPYIQSVKGTSGSVAKIQVQEGMWEVKRGEKVDGGERRKVQVRRKRLLEERKTSRT